MRAALFCLFLGCKGAARRCEGFFEAKVGAAQRK